MNYQRTKNKGCLTDYHSEDIFSGSVETAKPGTFNLPGRVHPSGLWDTQSLVEETTYLCSTYLNGKEHAIYPYSVISLRITQGTESGIFGLFVKDGVCLCKYLVFPNGSDAYGRPLFSIKFERGKKVWFDFTAFESFLDSVRASKA